MIRTARTHNIFSLSNNEVTLDNYVKRLETFLDQRTPQMVLVLPFGSATKRIISRIPKIYFSQHSWIFWYETSKGRNVIGDLSLEFRDVTGIDFDSRSYVATFDEVHHIYGFYEMFRKYENQSLIISRLCSTKIEFCGKPDFIWNRRKDLSGVHFKVALNPNDSLVFQPDLVRNRSQSCKINVVLKEIELKLTSWKVGALLQFRLNYLL